MTTDFEKQFGDYGDLTDPLSLGSAAMASGQYPNRAEESQATRILRLVGKGATFGLGNTGQTPIEAQNIPEHIAEFGGSIPSTILATMAAGPVLGAVAPGLARLAPLARQTITAGALGGTIGTGRAIQSGDIKDIPTEAAWWAGSELGGQALFKGASKLFGKGAKIAPPGVTPPVGELHGPMRPTGEEREFYEFLASRDAQQKGNIINRILNPDDISSSVPGERVQIPSQGPRTFLPPKEMPISPGEGPAVRFIKVGEDPINFDEIPDLVLDTPLGSPAKVAKPGTVELHRAEAPGTTGETFTTDRTQAFKDAKTVGGYLKTIEVPEGDLAKYQSGKGYRIPQKVQKELGVGEHEPMDIPYYEKEVTRGAKLRPPEGRKPIEMSLEDEFGNVVEPRSLGPLTEGQAAREAFPATPDPNAIPFRVVPPEPTPIYKPIKKPSLDGFVEKPHENPIMAENLAKPLKEVTDKATGITMVVPKTTQSAYIMNMAGQIVRNVEPPITTAMREDLIKPLNKAKLDHGVQVEQYRTSNLIKKSDEEIERITKDAEGRLVVKPLQFKSIDESAVSQRITRNLERQGMTTAQMQEFVTKKTAEWDATYAPPSFRQPPGGIINKSAWLKNEIANELKRRGPC